MNENTIMYKNKNVEIKFSAHDAFYINTNNCNLFISVNACFYRPKRVYPPRTSSSAFMLSSGQ